MFGIGAPELLIVGIIAVILFGNRLPSVARSLGKSMTEFKKGMREFESEMHSSIYSEPAGRVSYNEQIAHATPPAAEKPAATTDQPASEPQPQ
jgi:sec-independent protein translocase protein TatA